jgi:hypothetical protein
MFLTSKFLGFIVGGGLPRLASIHGSGVRAKSNMGLEGPWKIKALEHH